MNIGARILAEIPLGTWTQEALCAEVDPELFHPEHGQGSTRAKRICRQCTVADKCLEYALTCGVPTVGVWGGTTEGERRQLRRELGIGNRLEVRTHGTESGARMHRLLNEIPCQECLDAASHDRRQRRQRERTPR